MEYCVSQYMPIEFSRPAQQTFSTEFRARILYIYSYFPELLNKAIICGSIKKRGRVEGIAIGWISPAIFRLRPNVSNYTIAHELTHLVQGNRSGIPHGEVACDIWTVNRMPAELLDQRPYYLLRRFTEVQWKRDRITIKELCKQAIEIRKTQKNYIAWLQCQIRNLHRNSSKAEYNIT